MNLRFVALCLLVGCGTPVSPGLTSVTHGKGTWVAVGSGGRIVTSTDLKSWTLATSGTSTDLKDVRFDHGRFIAVGKRGTVLVSDDGTNWTLGTTKTGLDLNAVTWFPSASLWLAVGDKGEISTSPDGVSWTVRHTGTAWLSDVAASDTGLLAIEAGAVGELTSSDGLVWTRTTPPASVGGRCGAGWSNGTWVSANYDGNVYRRPGVSSSAVWQTSATGIWTAGGGECDVVATPSVFVIVDSNDGKVFTSSDGTTWTPVFTSSKGGLWGATVDGDELVAVGERGALVHAPCPGGICGAFSEDTITVNDTASSTPAAASCSVSLQECCGGSGPGSFCGVPTSTCDSCPTGTRKGVICTANAPCHTTAGVNVGARICECL